MTIQEFQKLGRTDPEAQNRWCISRDEKLKKLWHCSCGRKLPTSGYIWKKRYHDFVLSNRFENNPRCGYLCDYCANCREQGIDEY